MRLAGLEGLGRLMRIDGLRTLDWLMRLGILLAAMVLAAGCSGGSSDEPGPDTPTPGPGESSTPIAFSAQQDEGQGVTRAGTPLKDIVTSFKVWGFKNMSDGSLQTVFPGYMVNYYESSAQSTTTNSNGWEYVNQPGGVEQTIKYWDWSVSAYRFFGVAPATATFTVTEDQVNHLMKITIDANATSTDEIAATSYYSRLWYSTGVLPEYSSRQFGQPVQLEFLKPLSRVRFMYKYVSPRDGVTIGTQHFQPTGSEKIYLSGKVMVTYPLTGTEPRESTTISEEGTPLADGFTVDCESDPANYPKTYPANVPEGWYTVLPNTTQGSYTLTVDINGTPKTATVPAEFMHWLPGYSYTYVFKINADGGVEIGWVDYAVTPWTEMEGNRTVYNW